MKDLVKLLALQLVSAVGIYLLLFLLGKSLAFIGWLLIIAAALLVLYIKRRRNAKTGDPDTPWWVEKAKRGVSDFLYRRLGGTGGRP